MKKLLTLALICLAYATSFGQNVPQGIAYQAVAVKDGAYSVAGQNPQAIYWSNKDIKVRFTIFDKYPNGSSQYSEVHTTSTDDYGVFNLIIGQGSGLSGDFTTIPWELGDAHLQVEIDFENTNKYVLSVIEKFWSVPFTLHSRSADTLLGVYEETDPIFNGSVAKGITSNDTTYWNNKLDSYTETDPVFNSSVAKGITSTDTTYWNNKLDSYTETDPIFNSSVAKGITSTDTAYWNNKLDSYTETDPIFNSSVAKGITSNDTTYWNNKLDSYTETDPIFNGSVAKGITSNDTTYWNNKLDSYTETDPVFNSSVAKGITSTDTTYWNNKLDSYTETDPIFNSSVAKGITSTDTAYWNNKLDSYTETDPIFNSSVAKGITSNDTTYWNNKLDSYTETDPIFNSSVAKGITSSDTTYWNNKLDSYTETDPIFNSSIAKGITSNDTTYWNNKLDSYTETDPIFNSSVAKGITSTDTAYWNANQDVDSTNELQQISISNDTLFLSNGGFVKLPNSLGQSVSSSTSLNSTIEYHSLTSRSISPANSISDTFNFTDPIDGFNIFWTANYRIYASSNIAVHALDEQGDTIALNYSKRMINLGIDGTSNRSSRPSINNDWGTKQVISDGLSIGNTNWSSGNGHITIEAKSANKIHKLVVKQSAGAWSNRNITQQNIGPNFKLYTVRNDSVGNGSTASSDYSIYNPNTTNIHGSFSMIGVSDTSWIIPSGISKVTFAVWGCNGGNSGQTCVNATSGCSWRNSSGGGGQGVDVRFSLFLNPGDTIYMKSGTNGTNGTNSVSTCSAGTMGGNGDTMMCYVNSQLLFTNIGGLGGTGGVSRCGYAPPPGTVGASGQINFFTNAISGSNIANETSFGDPAYGLSDFEITNSLSYKGINTSGRILLMY